MTPTSLALIKSYSSQDVAPELILHSAGHINYSNLMHHHGNNVPSNKLVRSSSNEAYFDKYTPYATVSRVYRTAPVLPPCTELCTPVFGLARI
jgi:hypothetical protein